jgi:hypothetical protein
MKKKMETVFDERALAITAEEIVLACVKEKISFCLPYTIGWKYLDEHIDKNRSKIVYYTP